MAITFKNTLFPLYFDDWNLPMRDHVKKPRPVCRRDNGSVCDLPIYAGFGPQNITVIMSQESHYWNAFLIRIHFPHPPKYGSYGSYYTSLERSGWGDCSAVGIVGNGSVLEEKFREQVLQYGFWDGK